MANPALRSSEIVSTPALGAADRRSAAAPYGIDCRVVQGPIRQWEVRRDSC